MTCKSSTRLCENNAMSHWRGTVFSLVYSSSSWFFHKMDGQMKQQTENFLFFLSQLYCGRHKQNGWQSTNCNSRWTAQELLHSYGKRSDDDSVAPEHHWGGSIATDEHSGVTSPSEGLCHIPPSSKRLAGSADVQARKCLWTAPTQSDKPWIQLDNYVTKDQARVQVCSCPDNC